MNDQIFAPNIYLCAYQLHADQTLLKDHPLWENCDRLLHQLTNIQLKPHLDFSQSSDHRQVLLPDKQESISFTLTADPNIKGFVQPLLIQDSYALWLNIAYEDQDKNTKDVKISVLQKFNPDNSLIFPIKESVNETFLGETIFLTLQLNAGDRFSHSVLANNCYCQLFSKNSAPLSRSGELFGSPIFEYGNPRQPNDSPHVLIWLFQSKTTEETLDKYFNQIFDLLFHHHKIVKAYQDSRTVYNQLKKYYHSLDPVLDDIQTQIDNIHPDPQDDQHLENFKKQLKLLSSDALAYERLLRKMKDLLTTIQINVFNYNEKITNISAQLAMDQKEQDLRSLLTVQRKNKPERLIADSQNNEISFQCISPEELSFLAYFGKKTAPSFQRQIKADLSYFEQGTNLISQAIATIRAIVAIDQLQCDQKQQATLEQNRQRTEASNQKLQDQIQALGVGIAIASIISSCFGLVSQSWLDFWRAFFVSLFTAALVAYQQLDWIKRNRDQKYQSKFDKLLRKLFPRFFELFDTQNSLNSQRDQDR